MSIGGAISQNSAQNAAGAAQQQFNDVQKQYNEAARVSKVTQVQNAEASTNLEAFGKLDQNAQAARAAQSTAATAAGEAGVSGLSVAALQREYQSRAGEFAADVEANRSASIDRLQLQAQGYDVDEQNANARLPVPKYGSGLATLLNIGGALAEGATGAYKIYNKLPSTSGYDGYLKPGSGAGAYPGDTGGY